MSQENAQKAEIEAQIDLAIAHIETAEDDISQVHRDYLVERHGTMILDPLPAADPADPLNWPAWKVCFSISLISSR